MRIFRDVKEIDEIPADLACAHFWTLFIGVNTTFMPLWPDTTGLSYSIPTVTFTPVGTKSSLPLVLSFLFSVHLGHISNTKRILV